MAYETKVILTTLARRVGDLETVEEAYTEIAAAANVEGVSLPSYAEYKQETAALRAKIKAANS